MFHYLNIITRANNIISLFQISEIVKGIFTGLQASSINSAILEN